MSSVIVRGMEMPESCGMCVMRRSNYDRIWCHPLGEYMDFEHEFDGRRPDCPLVEISLQPWQIAVLENILNGNAPTVVPAERSGE